MYSLCSATKVRVMPFFCEVREGLSGSWVLSFSFRKSLCGNSGSQNWGFQNEFL